MTAETNAADVEIQRERLVRAQVEAIWAEQFADVIAAVRLDTADRIARYLRQQATLRFDTHGPHDPRGAALWDAGCAVLDGEATR